MLYLIYGEDSYRSRKKVREITDRFYAVAGARESAVRLILPESSREELEQVITTGSLFRKKRLVVLEDPSEAAADVAGYLEERVKMLAASDDIFVVWDRSVNANTGILASVARGATKIQDAKRLGAPGAARFLEEEAKERGIALGAAAKKRILADYAGDSWHMMQELEKSALSGSLPDYDTKGTAMVNDQPDQMLFTLQDAFGLGERTKAWCLYHSLIRLGMESEKIFWRLLSSARAIASVGALMQSGAAAGDMPRLLGMHPFVVKKAAFAASRIPEQKRGHTHTALCLLDFEIKQGRGDLSLGLERILLSL